MTNTNTLSMSGGIFNLLNSLFIGKNINMASYNENVNIEIKNFVLNDKLYIFNKPITLSVEKKDGMFLARDEIFDIFIYTKNYEDIEKEYDEDFAELYEAFALEEDCNLDDDAKILKQQYLDYCKVQ